MTDFGQRSKYFPSARYVTCIGTSNLTPLVTKPWSRLCIWNCACCACKHRCNYALGEKGWRSGESTRLPPMWPGFESWRRRHMWVEFVVASLPCLGRFFSGYSGFPLSSKPTLPNSKKTRNQLGEEPLSRCATSKIVIYLFIYLFIYMFTFKVVQSIPALRTPHYYGQFALSLGKESLYIFS